MTTQSSLFEERGANAKQVPEPEVWHRIESQRWKFKQQHPDYLLLFRVGDEYRALMQDAAHVAELCGVKILQDWPCPSAAIPYASVEVSLRRLICAGHRVALAEEVE